MKNILKIATILLSVLSFSAAQAGDLAVTGTAKASYTITSSDSTSAVVEQGKGLGVANEFDLTASGELDNGFTWSYQTQIDADTTQDDGKLTLTTPYGTAGIFISEGGLEFSKKGAVTANGDRASDTGYDEGMVEEYSIGDMSSIQLHSPADLLPYGITLKFAHAPDTSGNMNSVNAQGAAGSGTASAVTTAVTGKQAAKGMGRSMTSYQINSEPLAGLNIGASYSDFDVNDMAQKPEAGSAYISYKYGPATVAYGEARISHAIQSITSTDLIESTENKKMSVSVLVNDDLSVSYSQEESVANHQTTATVDVELESSSIAAAYTMGGMTLAVAQVSHQNVGYVANKDVNSTVFNVYMAL
jgi:hypothetical protein